MKQILYLFALGSFAHAANWTIIDPNCATYILSITASEDDRVFAAGALNGVGNVILESTDGNTFERCLQRNGCLPSNTVMMMGIAASPEGAVATTGFAASTYSEDNGATFKKNEQGPDSTVASQDIQFNANSGIFGVTGDFPGGVQGVSTSVNGGKNWTLSGKIDCIASIVRYGSFPSLSTWYVSAGEWPAAPVPETSSMVNPRPLSKAISLTSEGARVVFKGDTESIVGEPGYIAELVKTTDGGETWNAVYTNINGSFYFNGINCFDENTCVVCGEGETGVVLATSDGGLTWTTILDTKDSSNSFMSVKMLSPTEVWAVGAIIGRASFTGAVYKTTDMGMTWTVDTLPDAYFMSVSVRNSELAYGAVLTLESTGSIAKYSD